MAYDAQVVQAARERLEQRRRDALAGNIRDDHCQMIVVHQKEIVEVAPHFFCRRHGCEDVKLLAFGESGKDAGKH